MKLQNKKFRIIECSGTAYQIGRQYGKAAKENLCKGFEMLMLGLRHNINKLPADRNTILSGAKKYLNNAQNFDPEGIERIKGVADGAGISFDEAFAINCYTELIVNYHNLASMCTSFAITGSATKDGITMLGQNIDWHPETPLDLLHIRHTDGLEQLSIAFFGAPCLSLTSAGLGNSTNLTICPCGPVTMHVPLSCYLYAAMRKRSFEEALDVLRRAARGIIYTHLADSAGRITGIESVYDEYTEHEPEQGVLVHANHYETSDYAKNDGALTLITDSFHRAPRLRHLISQHHGKLTPKLMMMLLADHDGHPNSICRHVDPAKPGEFASMSTASLIMIPAEKKMFISSGPPCEYEYNEYNI